MQTKLSELQSHHNLPRAWSTCTGHFSRHSLHLWSHFSNRKTNERRQQYVLGIKKYKALQYSMIIGFINVEQLMLAMKT